jgi:hypothetical protein
MEEEEEEEEEEEGGCLKKVSEMYGRQKKAPVEPRYEAQYLVDTHSAFDHSTRKGDTCIAILNTTIL